MNALKDNSAPFHMRVSPVKPVEQPPRVSSMPASEPPPPSIDSPLEKNNENTGDFTCFMTSIISMINYYTIQ